jgi:diguanylate cyclase (GGDEF)-like protein
MFSRDPAVVAAALGVGLAAGVLASRQVWRGKLAAARHAATHDGLTGIYNRAGLTDHADRFIAAGHRSGRPVVVLLIDLVGFKRINDTHGHDAGDHILTTIGARLAGVAGPVGIAARLGGDEFAAVTTGPTDHRTDPHAWLSGWLPHIHARLTTPVAYLGRPLAVGATIGATLAHPGHPLPVWLAAADRAMYAARSARTTTAIAPAGPAATCGGHRSGRVRESARPTTRVANARPAIA